MDDDKRLDELDKTSLVRGRTALLELVEAFNEGAVPLDRIAEAAHTHMGPHLWRQIIRRVRNEADAEEVYNEVLLKFCDCVEKRKPFHRTPEAYLVWLSAMRANSRYRRNKRQAAIMVEGAAADKTFETALTTAKASDALEQHSLARAVRNAIGRLRPSLRVALGASYSNTQTAKEVAEKMGVPTSTLTGRISRARRQIREELRLLSGGWS